VIGVDFQRVFRDLAYICSFFEENIHRKELKEVTVFETGSGGLWGITQICTHLINTRKLDEIEIVISEPGFNQKYYGEYWIDNSYESIEKDGRTLAVIKNYDVSFGTFKNFIDDENLILNINGINQEARIKDICLYKPSKYSGHHVEIEQLYQHREQIHSFMKHMLRQRHLCNIKVILCGKLSDEDNADWSKAEKVLGENKSKQIFYFNTHVKMKTSIGVEQFLRKTYPKVIVAYSKSWKSRKLFSYLKPFLRMH